MGGESGGRKRLPCSIAVAPSTLSTLVYTHPPPPLPPFPPHSQVTVASFIVFFGILMTCLECNIGNCEHVAALAAAVMAAPWGDGGRRGIAMYWFAHAHEESACVPAAAAVHAFIYPLLPHPTPLPSLMSFPAVAPRLRANFGFMFSFGGRTLFLCVSPLTHSPCVCLCVCVCMSLVPAARNPSSLLAVSLTATLPAHSRQPLSPRLPPPPPPPRVTCPHHTPTPQPVLRHHRAGVQPLAGLRHGRLDSSCVLLATCVRRLFRRI